MSTRCVFPGITLKEWDRACRWAKKYTERMTGRAWHDDAVAGEYMGARNGYLAGHRAGRRK